MQQMKLDKKQKLCKFLKGYLAKNLSCQGYNNNSSGDNTTNNETHGTVYK